MLAGFSPYTYAAVSAAPADPKTLKLYTSLRNPILFSVAAACNTPPLVVYELSIQVCGTLANGFLVELMDWMPPDLFEALPQCVGGSIRIPERPGHGMVLAKGAVAKYRSA